VLSVPRAHDGMCRAGSSTLSAETRQRSSASKSNESLTESDRDDPSQRRPGFHKDHAGITIHSAFVTKPVSIASASEAVPLAPMLTDC
jgi:hypothetical protein